METTYREKLAIFDRQIEKLHGKLRELKAKRAVFIKKEPRTLADNIIEDYWNLEIRVRETARKYNLSVSTIRTMASPLILGTCTGCGEVVKIDTRTNFRMFQLDPINNYRVSEVPVHHYQCRNNTKIKVCIEAYKKKQSEIYAAIYKMVPYQDYLKTVHWETTRKMVLKTVGFKCEECGVSKVRLYVHHKHYNTLGCEIREDLLVVCGNCHDEIHRKRRMELWLR